MLPIHAKTTVRDSPSEKKERQDQEFNNLALLTNCSLVLPRWLLATFVVREDSVFVVREDSSMEVGYPKSLTTVVLAQFSRLPFVLLHMAFLCHPYI